MKYEKPELKLEKFTFEPVMAEFTSALDPVNPPSPTTGPVIEGNNPFEELGDAFGSIFNLGR